jgi:putative FmdB family regulatory protein
VPTYQYVCSNSDDKHEFEVVQSFSDPSLTECPQCGSPVRKVYGSVGVVFKGSGFYRTDSRAGGSGDGGSSSSKESSSKESSSTESSKGSSSKESSGGGDKAATTSKGSGSSSSGSTGTSSQSKVAS